MSSALSIVRKYHPQVTSVVDATRSTRIQVTERDCKASTSKSPSECALATAFRRKHEGAVISLAVAYLVDGKKATRYRVPSCISREIVSFDRGQYFAPGKYTLAAPVSTERLSVMRANKAWSKKGGKHPPSIRRLHKTVGIRSLI